MKKIKYLFFLVILTLLLQCGIEDTLFLEAPKNVTVEGSNPQQNKIYFTADNKEEDNGKYLLIGYDVYYSFEGFTSYKKAMVKDPVVSTNPFQNLINFKTLEPSRFVNFSTTNDIYQQFTIPVTTSMINVLDGTPANVEFYFHDTLLIANNSSDTNPKLDAKVVRMELIYPAYEEYYGKDWNDSNFKGFYDKDYYDYYGIKPVETLPSGNLLYKATMYIVARGFSSGTLQRDFISSARSNYVTVYFEVDPSTKKP